MSGVVGEQLWTSALKSDLTVNAEWLCELSKPQNVCSENGCHGTAGMMAQMSPGSFLLP